MNLPCCLGVGCVCHDKVGGNVHHFHGKNLRQPTVKSCSTKNVDGGKSLQMKCISWELWSYFWKEKKLSISTYLILYCTIVNRIGPSRRDEVENAGVRHATYCVGCPTHKWAVIHLSLEVNVPHFLIQNVGIYFPQFIHCFVTSNELNEWKPPS